MPMMAVYEQNDALTSARSLATMTLDELEGREAVEESVMVNMFRMLDGYRAHGYYGLEEEDDGSGDEFGGSAMAQSGERRLGDVRVALERTVSALGPEAERVLDDVEATLRAAAYGPAVRDEVRDRTRQFLASLITNLRPFAA